jgi:hypothetical protein
MKTRLLKRLRRMADKTVTIKKFVDEIGGRIYEGYIVRWRFNRAKRFTIYDDYESPATEAMLFYTQKRNEFIEKELEKIKNQINYPIYDDGHMP